MTEELARAGFEAHIGEPYPVTKIERVGAPPATGRPRWLAAGDHGWATVAT